MQTQIHPEDWSKTTAALRHLAAELVEGREQREDLVQGTLVAALERPPRRLSWSWLACVLRNRASDLMRSRASRGLAVGLPSLESATPDATEIAQRLELQEALTRALRALDEPYQTTLYLRFFEDLTPSEIARRSGVPVKTVKTRLERGLERLRQRLEARHGPKLGALLAFLRPLRLPQPLALAPTIGGVLLMWKKIAIVAVVLLAGLVWWRVERSGEAEAGLAAPSTSQPIVPEVAQDSSKIATPDSSQARARSAAVDQAPPAAVKSRFGSLDVLVRWSDGTPAPGIAINFRRELQAADSSKRGFLRATSDAEGHASSGDLLPGSVHVASGRGGSKKVQIIAGESSQVVLDLPKGLEVDGRVLDGHDRPVANAEIWLTSSYTDWLGMSLAARSDLNGAFQLRDVVEDQSLGATAQGFAPSELVDLELLEKHDGRVEVVLRASHPGGSLQGRVIDTRGAPVQGANVCVGIGTHDDLRADGTFAEQWAPRQARTDGDGRFRFEGLPEGAVPVAVWLSAAPQWTGSAEVHAGATAELAVTLQDGASIGGIVRDAQGAPVAGAIVRIFERALLPWSITLGQYDDPSVFGSPLTVTDAGGSYQIENAWPGEVHAYASPTRNLQRFRAQFHAEAVLHPVAGQHTAWDPVLEPGRTIRGYVRYSDGVAMDNVFVHATEQGAGEHRTLHLGEDGRFEFFNLPPGPFKVDVQLNSPPREAGPLFKDGIYPDGVEFDLVARYPSPEKNPSASVRGKFKDPLGRFAKTLTPVLESPDGTGRYPRRADDEGFEFRGIAAGRYRVVGQFAEEVGFISEPFELQAGEQLDLGILMVAPGASLTLHLRRASELEGEQVSYAYLHPRDALRQSPLDFSSSDEVVLKNLTLGAYELKIYGGPKYAQVMRSFELKADMELDLPLRPYFPRIIEFAFDPTKASGSLHLTIRDAQGELFEDTTLFNRWNEHSPFGLHYNMPAGHFTVRAESSSGLVASGEIHVEFPGGALETLHFELR
ncbi:MAG: sigma-70 family RNA polymerase sigma factor [Planctomycetota bacterium]